MALGSIKNVFKGKMTKEELRKLAAGLRSAYHCVDNFEALQDKGGYDLGRQFPQDLYQNGVQKELLDLWLSREPTVHVLNSVGRRYCASQAGREWARFLRVRDKDAAILRVYVKDQNGSPEKILLRILTSLVWNLVALAPAEFERSEGLTKRQFDSLQRCDPGSFRAGIAILKGLPNFHLRGDKMLCIIDGLDIVETYATMEDLRVLDRVLRSVIGRNRGHLLYTMDKKMLYAKPVHQGIQLIDSLRSVEDEIIAVALVLVFAGEPVADRDEMELKDMLSLWAEFHGGSYWQT
ncbi:hypothetical protein F5Y15DRAFT_414185 [Xylariaceae sp. FL0016]|nr:hypothetical protein F5Y15DRAFT_414185 [Xylariaceae sp. FL0016]